MGSQLRRLFVDCLPSIILENSQPSKQSLVLQLPVPLSCSVFVHFLRSFVPFLASFLPFFFFLDTIFPKQNYLSFGEEQNYLSFGEEVPSIDGSTTLGCLFGLDCAEP